MPDNRKPLIYGALPVCRNYTVRAHICDVITEKRRGRADSFRNAGSLQRRIHAQHLRSLDVRHETERGRRDRKHHPQRDLTPKPKRRLQVAAAVQTFKIFLKQAVDFSGPPRSAGRVDLYCKNTFEAGRRETHFFQRKFGQTRKTACETCTAGIRCQLFSSESSSSEDIFKIPASSQPDIVSRSASFRF